MGSLKDEDSPGKAGGDGFPGDSGHAHLEVPFSLRGVAGTIAVELQRDEEPSAWGVDLLHPRHDVSAATGYPVCTATVNYPVTGYGAAMGWVQLVRSDDGPLGPEVFAPDPIAMHADVPSPYCWFGFAPTLFDAPFRGEREDLNWIAHSFLCFTPTALMSKEVHPIAGFAWGFVVTDGEIEVVEPAILPLEAWDAHGDILRESYPGWVFGASHQS